MRKLLLFLIAGISINCYSQITYEKGYFISNDGKKIDCFIKNIDWKNNPTSFEYKISEDGKTNEANIKSTQEFGIDNTSKYIRNKVKIDRSSDHLNHLDKKQNVDFKEEQLFLKALVEGKASLYYYVDGNLNRFFYNLDNTETQQLVFKRYLNSDNVIARNDLYRRQLWNDLKCATIKISRLENLDYKRSQLVKLFTDYNTCNDAHFKSYEPNKNRGLFNLNIRPRLTSTSLAIQSANSSTRNFDFGNELGFALGIEAEYVLPFNKNKWAIFTEPTYKSFKTEKTVSVTDVSGGELKSTVDLSYVEIPLGFRHYFFLGDDSKIFINASYVLDLTSNTTMQFTRADGSELYSLKIDSHNNTAFGLGYKYKDKYSVELRYMTERDILRKSIFWSSDYKTISIIFGYSIL